MIQIDSEDRNAIQGLLANYKPDDFDKILTCMTPILLKYSVLEPPKIGKRLLDSLFSSWNSKPLEAIVHYWAICKLVSEFNYPPEQIDHEVSCGAIGRAALGSGDTQADVVVYSHPTRRPGTALIAIECREYGGVEGSIQAASYSRALGAAYHLFTDSERWNAFETQPHPVNGVHIINIPKWVGYKPLKQRLSKEHLLPPITDEEHLRGLIRVCHNQIHSEGLDPAKAFDELVKLFFVKVYDEHEIPNEYRFSVLAGESEDETGENIRQLLKEAKAKSQYKELFVEPGDDEFWVQNSSIRKVVETFQGFSFTTSTLIGIDSKGTVYENMVGATFRGELGQYFTPRKIVEFMVDLLAPTREDLVLDPSCGSGGFLVYVMRKIASQIRKQQQNLPQHRTEQIIRETVLKNVKGTDISPRMVRATRMNMIMHGDGWSGIQRFHGLRIQKHEPFQDLSNNFTLILSNPPFAGFESNESILKQFDTGKNKYGNVRGINRAIIFVEQIVRLLAEGGRAGIVLPRSIFENESYGFRKIRDIIFENCEILAVVGLPKTAFHHTDCGILGDLLFVERRLNPRESYDVFVAWAENVGYNTLGHNIEDNDLPGILSSYLRNENLIPISKIKSEHNLNPWHYHPNAERLRKEVEESRQKLVSLAELVSVYNNRISKSALKQTPNRMLRYIEVRDFDPDTGSMSFNDKRASELPSRATYELNGEELVLLPTARNSLESRRKIVKVGEDTNGMVMTNRFLPLRPNVNVDFVVMALNSQFVRDQLIAICRGAGAPDLRETKLTEVMVPVPDSTDLSSIDVFMEEISDKIERKTRLEKDVKELMQEIDNSIAHLQQ